MITEDELNKIHITIEDLLFVSEQVQKLPKKDRDLEGRTHLMVRLFKGEPDKSMAIEYRLTAMSELITSGSLPHWALPVDESGATNIAEPVWFAATTETLIFEKYRVYFEPSSFIARVLALAEPEGNA